MQASATWRRRTKLTPTLALEILGPHSAAGFSQYISLPFTPTANAHVYQVRAAIQYLSAGTANEVNISLYSDNAGIPGILLAGPITVSNLSSSGCCQLAIELSLPVSRSLQELSIGSLPILLAREM